MTKRYLKIHPDDNVYVALTDLSKGETLTLPDNSSLQLVDDIPAKHKFTDRSLKVNDEVVMYGVVVGRTVLEIPRGGVIGSKCCRVP